MKRIEAQLLVDRITARVGVYGAVMRIDAQRLLGEEVYSQLLSNKVKNLGPTPDSIYPWNVVDYFQPQPLGEEIKINPAEIIQYIHPVLNLLGTGRISQEWFENWLASYILSRFEVINVR